MPKVLVICRANVFRSPLATGLLKQVLGGDPEWSSWEFVSAGTWTKGGVQPDQRVRKELALRGISTLGKRSQEVTRRMVEDADLVLTMTGSQQEAIQVEFPDQAGKVHMFSELDGERVDIPDPAGRDGQAFQEVLDLIEGYVERAGENLQGLLEK